MKSIKEISVSLVLACVIVFAPSCKKKEVGVCYCKYLSGDKKEFNLMDLTRNQQIDSCNQLDHNANAFAGDCKLK